MDSCPHSPENMGVLPIYEWGPVVKIRLIQDGAEFTAHRDLIRHHSGYFDAFFSGRWGNNNAVELSQGDATSFGAFLHFIYSNRLPSAPFGTVKTDSKTKQLQTLVIGDGEDEGIIYENELAEYRWAELCEIYVLADFLLVPTLRSAVIDRFRRSMTECWSDPWDYLEYVYCNTTSGCGLRRLLADWFAKTGNGSKAPDDWKENMDVLPKEFLFDVVLIMQGVKYAGWNPKPASKKDWETVNKCLYHDHNEMEKKEGDDRVPE